MSGKPTMFMIAGPNGAGKSTLYKTRIAPRTAAPFINADIIQREELKDPSMDASYKAAEIAESRRRDHLAQHKDFISESTFSHPSKLQLVDDAKNAGFRVVVYHVNLRSPDLSVKRVATRVAQGEHNVPEDKIRERFERNPALIREAVLRADRAYIYDNSTFGKEPALHMKFKDGQVIQVSENVPTWARNLYAKELEPFSPARLNPAAASFADAKLLAENIGGAGAGLRIPDQGKNQIHEGKIVGETALHWVQQTHAKTFVAHFKSGLNGDINLQSLYRIKSTDRGQADVELIQPCAIGAKMTAPEHASALAKLGGEGVGLIECPMPYSEHTGKIIQYSDTHIVQKIDKNHAIAHDISKLSNGRELESLARAGKLQSKQFNFRYAENQGSALPVLTVPTKKAQPAIDSPLESEAPTKNIKR